MQKLHTKLAQKYPFYHNWHQTKHHNKIHWGVLVGFVLVVFSLIFNFAYDAAGNESGKSTAASAAAQAQTGNIYYVDQNHIQASDSNPGTEALPWKTIQKAANTLVAGDTVLVRAGLYSMQGELGSVYSQYGIYPKNSGISGSPIIYKAYPWERVIIDQGNEYAGFLIANKSNITISGFEIQNLYGNGVGTHDNSSYITVENNVIHDANAPAGANIGAISFNFCSRCTARGNKLYNVSVNGDMSSQNASAIGSNYDMEYAIIENNEMFNTANGVFHKRSSGNKGAIIRNNLMHDLKIYCIRYSVGGVGDPPHIDQEVYQNICYNTPIGISATTWETSSPSTGLNIHNNVFHNQTLGIGINGYKDVNIWNNIFFEGGTNYYERAISTTGESAINSISLSNYNIFYPPARFLLNVYSSSEIAYNTLAAWRSGISFDLNSLNSDPLFVSVLERNYHLQSVSPGINAGIDRQDYDGDGDTTERINMGAYITGNEVIGLPPVDNGSGPVINSLSGNLTHNSAVTITGGGFGAKNIAKPVIWDNFESGSDGTTIKGNLPVIGPVWDDYYNGLVPPQYSSAMVRLNSKLSSFHDFVNGGNNISLEYFGNHSTVYFTFWWKMTKQSTSWSRNIKPWIEYGSDGVFPMAYAGLGQGNTGDAGLRSSVQDNPNPPVSTLWGKTLITDIESEWVRFEVYLVQSTPNVADGKYKMWVHRPYTAIPSITLDLNSDSYITRTTLKNWHQWHFGSYFAKDTPADARAEIYIDDIYFDTTQARVEIGNAPLWTAVTHREILIPSAWSANSITITANQGSFTNSQIVYLYVVDENGNVNENGYPVTVGGVSSDTQFPTTPTGLTAQTISSSQINLSWTASTDDVGVAGYKIYRNNSLLTTQNSQLTTYSDTGLQPSTTYTYTVSAHDAAGNDSSQSTSVSVTTLAAYKQSDLNQDGKTDQLDFDILKQDYNRTDKPSSDLNQDGIVDSRDLGILMGEWSR